MEARYSWLIALVFAFFAAILGVLVAIFIRQESALNEKDLQDALLAAETRAARPVTSLVQILEDQREASTLSWSKTSAEVANVNRLLLTMQHNTELSDAVVDYTPFKTKCREVVLDDNAFATFRREPEIIDMLEHVRMDDAQIFAEMIRNIASEQNLTIPWKKVEQNDAVGGAARHPFEFQGTTVQLSTTSVRYVYFALLALQQMKDAGMSTVNIVEIGGGYGGQCAVTNKLAPLFAVDVASYTILDLSHVSDLQRSFLQTQGDVDMSCMVLTQVSQPNLRQTLHHESFLFSAYAYSEISRLNQLVYNRLLEGFIDSGFVLWNSHLGPLPGFFSMISKSAAEVDIQREYPLTGASNFLYRF
jgi:hypothetical protein